MKHQMRMCLTVFALLLTGLMTAVACAQTQRSCQDPKLEFTSEQVVNLKTLVKWLPPDCAMVIETWRGGIDCKKIDVTDNDGRNPAKPGVCAGQGLQDVGVRSGDVTIEQIRGTQKGRIEIKIWVPNAGIVRSVFANVQ